MPGPFSSSARLYDLIYSHLDYDASAGYVAGVVRERNPSASSLLDVACGTGRHLDIWRHRFDRVEGVDVDEEMLAVARDRLGDVPLHRGDFTTLDLGRTFDAVTCLFSSIGYAHTPDRLDAAIASMGRHLAPGGVLVVEPWFRRSAIDPGRVTGLVRETDDVVVARTSRMSLRGDISELEFAYLVTTTTGSEWFTETHVAGLYDPDRYLEAARRAGLDAEFDPVGSALGRGMLIAVARP
jgi:SAM-dependent methyltransferase